jgi:hypothetical protein
MAARIPYQSIDLKYPVRVWAGRKKTSDVEAVSGTVITRIVDETKDEFEISGEGITRPVEVPWGNVAGAVRADVPAEKPRRQDRQRPDVVDA